MNRLKRWMDKYYPSFAATFAGLLVVALGGAAAQWDIPGMIGGVSRNEIAAAVQQSPVIAFETVREGIRYKTTATPPGNTQGNHEPQEKIQKATELIPQGIYVNESCIILVTANSKCAVAGNKNSSAATVITAITVDGIEAAEDCATGENGKIENLFSSAVAMWELEPGMHRLTAEGTFYGCALNPDTTMQYVLIRKGDKPMLKNSRNKNKL